jgi:uncharacterized protein (DUF488 family)
METLFTIGVYGYAPEAFFRALEGAGIDCFLDLRRRRGVRGSQYAFANAGHLQDELAARHIEYHHILELAPEEETRDLQSRQDRAEKIPRRQRTTLGSAFVTDYTSRTLDPYDFTPLIADLHHCKRPVLFCVEGSPQACHRGLVAERLSRLTGVPVNHLTP